MLIRYFDEVFMTVFRDYSKNGTLLDERDEPITSNNFKRYAEEYGIERARGYYDAIQDVFKIVENQVLHYEPYRDNTPARARTAIRKLHETHSLLLNQMSQMFEASSTSAGDNDTRLTP